MKRTPAKPAQREIVHDPALPRVAQAAQIALLILASSGRQTWSKLAADPAAQTGITISAAQQDLLDEFLSVIHLLSTAPARTLYCCPVCERWALIDPKDAPPARCSLTFGCQERTVKASTVAPRFPKNVPVDSVPTNQAAGS